MTAANILIVAGQSNALGYNVAPAELPTAYAPDAHVQIWNATTAAFETMQAGVNTGTANNPTAWGPEVGEAMAWASAHPGETLYIVKDTHGSTGIAADATQLDWSPSSAGEMYSTATTDIAAAKAALTAAGLTPHVVGVDWMQGEQDAVDATKAAAYGVNLADLFSHIETQWGDGDGTTEISFGRIASGDALAYEATVRSAQDAVTVGSAIYREIDTDAFAQQADNLHFTGAGQLSLASAFNAARQTVGTPDADNITGTTGADVINGFKGADTIQGGQGADSLYGGQGDDLIHGGRDSDILYGNLGNDWLSGDLGDDTATGGAGADTFYFLAGYGADHVTDFNAADGDRLQLAAGTTYTVTIVGADTVLTFDGGGSATLDGVTGFSTGWLVT